MVQHPQSQSVDYANQYLYHALTIGEMMLCCGAEVGRVEDSIRRICLAYGAGEVNVFTITSSIVVTICSPAIGSVTQTRRISGFQFDLHRLERLNDLSRHIAEKLPPMDQVSAALEEIRRTPRHSFLGQVFIYALISASFSLFFGGSAADAAAAAVIGVLLKCMDWAVRWLELNKFLAMLICSGFGGLMAFLFVRLGLGDNVDKINIGNIMVLIPGIALTNSLRDFFNGDTISGLLRFLEAVLLSMIIAGGFVLATLIGG